MQMSVLEGVDELHYLGRNITENGQDARRNKDKEYEE